MPQVSAGRYLIPYKLFQFFHFGKSAHCRAGPDVFPIDANFEDSTRARDENHFPDFGSKRR